MEFFDGFHNVVGHDCEVHVVESPGGGVGGVIGVGGGGVLLVQEGSDDGEDNVEEGEESEPNDDGEEEVALEGIANMDPAVHAEGISGTKASVDSAWTKKRTKN